LVDPEVTTWLHPDRFIVLDLDGTLHPERLGLIAAHQINREFPDRSSEYKSLLNHVKDIRVDSPMTPDFTKHAYDLYGKLIEGIGESEIRTIYERVWQRERLRVFDYAYPAVALCKRLGYRVALLSGSPHGLVSLAAKEFGLHHWQGVEYLIEDQINIGIVSVQVGSPGRKYEHFEHTFGCTPKLSIGNSSGDSDILGMSDLAIAFEPDSVLRSIATERDWIIVDRDGALDAIIEMTTEGTL
jgi:phosphoserine phosphatase